MRKKWWIWQQMRRDSAEERLEERVAEPLEVSAEKAQVAEASVLKNRFKGEKNAESFRGAENSKSAGQV